MFRTNQALDHTPSKVLKNMCEEFWEILQGGLEVAKTSEYLNAKHSHMNDLIQKAIPMPIDFIRGEIAVKAVGHELRTNSFYLAPILSFDFYEI